MKALAILAVTLASLAPAKPPKHKPQPCSHGSKLERRHCTAHRLCSNRRPRWCVENAIIHNRGWMGRWQRWWMRATPTCESGNDPLETKGAPNLGFYQFQAGTFSRTPYGHHSIWSAKWQSLAAAWMLRQGRASEWPNCP